MTTPLEQQFQLLAAELYSAAQVVPRIVCILQCAALKRYELIWSVVERVPRGCVATYGQIAELAGLEGHARQVGYALHNLPEKSTVPWHRVINAKGEISPRTAGDSHELQLMLLHAEGVVVDARGRVDLKRFRWKQSTSLRAVKSTRGNPAKTR